MGEEAPGRIGYACAYTPLAVLAAAGYDAYRMLPLGAPPDRAGEILHDNLCPHVKLLLNLGLSGELPDLAGVVFMNSCDAMRRLADGWDRVRPGDPMVCLDLPVSDGPGAADYLATELGRLAGLLEQWSGRTLSDGALRTGLAGYNRVCALLDRVRGRVSRGQLAGGSRRLQQLCNLAATSGFARAQEVLTAALEEPRLPGAQPGVPVYLFGNVLPDVAAFDLFEECGLRIVAEDLCTGSRLFQQVDLRPHEEPMAGLARAMLARRPCARTLSADGPGRLGEITVRAVREQAARGAIGYTLKFCDAYLARLPGIRDALRDQGIPLLMLEGDCTLRALGQQRTRLEAFAEMVEGAA